MKADSLFFREVGMHSLTCESFDLYTANNEVVEGHPFVLGVILGQDVLHKGGAEPVAHLRQG